MYNVDFICNKSPTTRDLTGFLRTISEKAKISIFIEKDSRRVNAHSLLGLLSLDLKSGDKLCAYCDDKSVLDFVKDYFS